MLNLAGDIFFDRDCAVSLCLNHAHVSLVRKYVYIDVPKTGSSTVKASLRSSEGGAVGPVLAGGSLGYSSELLEVHDARSTPLIRPRSSAELRGFVECATEVFAFVRNPFSRILSAYIDKIESHIERRRVFLDSLGFTSDKWRGAEPPDFKTFLCHIRDIPVGELDPHFRPQYCHLLGIPAYTFIGRFEHFGRDFRRIVTRIDPSMLRHVTNMVEHRTGAGEKLKRFYSDPAVVSLVKDVYAADFGLFDYPLDVGLAMG